MLIRASGGELGESADPALLAAMEAASPVRQVHCKAGAYTRSPFSSTSALFVGQGVFRGVQGVFNDGGVAGGD